MPRWLTRLFSSVASAQTVVASRTRRTAITRASSKGRRRHFHAGPMQEMKKFRRIPKPILSFGIKICYVLLCGKITEVGSSTRVGRRSITRAVACAYARMRATSEALQGAVCTSGLFRAKASRRCGRWARLVVRRPRIERAIFTSLARTLPPCLKVPRSIRGAPSWYFTRLSRDTPRA